MINQEEKEQFFAQYYGQKVYMNHPNCTNPSNYFMKQSTKAGDYLLLKPLHAISDEDAIEAGYKEGAKSATTTYRNIIGKHTDEADFLRSKGYALPFRGISVEEQIANGWVKLIEQ